jgi:hypothetical protein
MVMVAEREVALSSLPLSGTERNLEERVAGGGCCRGESTINNVKKRRITAASSLGTSGHVPVIGADGQMGWGMGDHVVFAAIVTPRGRQSGGGWARGEGSHRCCLLLFVVVLSRAGDNVGGEGVRATIKLRVTVVQ